MDFMNDFISFQYAHCLWHGIGQVGSSALFIQHGQLSSLKFLLHLHICITVGAYLVNYLTNKRCIVLFDSVQLSSNTQYAFYFPVNGTSIPEKENT